MFLPIPLTRFHDTTLCTWNLCFRFGVTSEYVGLVTAFVVNNSGHPVKHEISRLCFAFFLLGNTFYFTKSAFFQPSAQFVAYRFAVIVGIHTRGEDSGVGDPMVSLVDCGICSGSQETGQLYAFVGQRCAGYKALHKLRTKIFDQPSDVDILCAGGASNDVCNFEGDWRAGTFVAEGF